MITIGIMCCRDEEDLLPEVLDSLDGNLDYIYAYDDGSLDSTYTILRDHPLVEYVISKRDDKSRLDIHRPNYHHLLEKIKSDFDFNRESVWCVVTMGDRFYLNMTPREIVQHAEDHDVTAIEGGQLDFLRHRLEGWTPEIDTYPKYPESLRKMCRWFNLDELAIMAYKVTEEASYLKSKYPWPTKRGETLYSARSMRYKLSTNMPFVEHQGRRSPNAFINRYRKGVRKISRKLDTTGYNLFNYEDVINFFPRFYAPYRVLPWINNDSLKRLVELHNDDEKPGMREKVTRRYFYWGVEELARHIPIPPREDVR